MRAFFIKLRFKYKSLSKKHIQIIITIYLCCLTYVAHTQTIDRIKEIKLTISELILSKDVLAINNLIKQSTFLEPKYTLEILTKNLKFAEENKNSKQLADTYLVLGNFWFQQGNSVKAYDCFLKGEFNVRKINDLKLLGRLLLNKGNITQDLDSRIKTYEEAVQIFKQLNDVKNLSSLYLNIGDAYTNYVWLKIKKNPNYVLSSKDSSFYKKRAFLYYDKVDSLNNIVKDNFSISVLKIHKGEWYKYEKNYVKAKALFNEAKNILSENDNPKVENYCLLHIASIETIQGNFTKALDYLQMAEELSLKYDYKNYLQGVYDEYAKVYDSLNNYKMALAYQRLNTKATNDLNEANSKDKILALKLEYDLSEKLYQIEKYEAKEKLNKIILIVIISLAILVLGIAYLIIKNRQNKYEISELEKSSIEIKLNNKKLQEALLKEQVKYNQDHLITFANQINKIESFLEDLKSKVRTINKNGIDQTQINNLKIAFQELLHNKTDLQQINTLSNQQHIDFLFYLSKKHSDITKEDEQLISLILNGKTTREICEIFNISSSSLYTKRYRLRKKLNLEKEKSFEDLYNQFQTQSF